MTQSNKDLEATYGPAAPYSEHKRGDHITYTSAEGLRQSGEIVWVQAAFGDIGVSRYAEQERMKASDIITQALREFHEKHKDEVS